MIDPTYAPAAVFVAILILYFIYKVFTDEED